MEGKPVIRGSIWQRHLHGQPDKSKELKTSRPKALKAWIQATYYEKATELQASSAPCFSSDRIDHIEFEINDGTSKNWPLRRHPPRGAQTFNHKFLLGIQVWSTEEDKHIVGIGFTQKSGKGWRSEAILG